ncbi:ferredoxin-NADP reductase, partial [candidate division MSBL1 archaeon SCGC-AAA382A20]
MNEIISKEELIPKIKLFDVKDPQIAEKAKPGHFVVLRVYRKGERFPLTIAGTNGDGTFRVVVNEVGKSSRKLGSMQVGDEIPDLLGPLGVSYDMEEFGTVLCVGGGVYAAPIHYVATNLKEAGNEIITVLGARNEEKLIYEDELDEVSDELYITTDDGSKGYEGLDFIEDEILSRNDIDRTVGMGRISTLKKISELTEPYNLKTMVSLTPIMVDGTGMCGSCRVLVGGETKFACIDGPKFDAHEVDWSVL